MASGDRKCPSCAGLYVDSEFMEPCDPMHKMCRVVCSDCAIAEIIARCQGDEAKAPKCRKTGALECVYHVRVRFAVRQGYVVPSSVGLDMQDRFMCMNASSISTWLGRNRWEPSLDKALRDAFQLDQGFDNEAKARMAEGHLYQPAIAAVYQQLRKKREDGSDVMLESVPAAHHPKLPFLRATADYGIRCRKEQGKIGLAEIKRWAGRRKNWRVDLHKDPNKCDDYVDQLFLQMFCYREASVDLVCGSDGDGKSWDEELSTTMSVDYKRFQWDPAWWREAKTTIFELYNRYLRWFWEDDRSPERLAPMLDWLQKQKVQKEKIGEILRRRPLNPDHVRVMREWRKEVEAAAIATATVKT